MYSGIIQDHCEQLLKDMELVIEMYTSEKEWNDFITTMDWKNWILQRITICNEYSVVNIINQSLLKALPGDIITFKSEDNAICYGSTKESNQTQSNTMFVRSNDQFTFPTILELKVGLPVMLLRNLPPYKVGTICIVLVIQSRFIGVKVISGSNIGKQFMVPIIFQHLEVKNDQNMIVERKQFPLQPCLGRIANGGFYQRFTSSAYVCKKMCFYMVSSTNQ